MWPAIRGAPTRTSAPSRSICAPAGGPILPPAIAVATWHRLPLSSRASHRSKRPRSWHACSAWRHTMADGSMFAPLSADEAATAAEIKPNGITKHPIIPVPASAPPQNFRHPNYGTPTKQSEYQLASGELRGYACRFDFVRDDGAPDKDVLL